VSKQLSKGQFFHFDDPHIVFKLAECLACSDDLLFFLFFGFLV